MCREAFVHKPGLYLKSCARIEVLTQFNNSPLQPIATQSLQQSQAGKGTPILESFKSPSSATNNKHDENSFSSSPNPFIGRASSATPQQAPLRPFNPTINNFERQRPNSTQSPLNATAPAIPTSPAPIPCSGPSPGYSLFKMTYFRFSTGMHQSLLELLGTDINTP